MEVMFTATETAEHAVNRLYNGLVKKENDLATLLYVLGKNAKQVKALKAEVKVWRELYREAKRMREGK